MERRPLGRRWSLTTPVGHPRERPGEGPGRPAVLRRRSRPPGPLGAILSTPARGAAGSPVGLGVPTPGGPRRIHCWSGPSGRVRSEPREAALNGTDLPKEHVRRRLTPSTSHRAAPTRRTPSCCRTRDEHPRRRPSAPESRPRGSPGLPGHLAPGRSCDAGDPEVRPGLAEGPSPARPGCAPEDGSAGPPDTRPGSERRTRSGHEVRGRPWGMEGASGESSTPARIATGSSRAHDGVHCGGLPLAAERPERPRETPPVGLGAPGRPVLLWRRKSPDREQDVGVVAGVAGDHDTRHVPTTTGLVESRPG